MELFKLMATLGLDSKEYEKGIDQAEKSANKYGGTMTKLGSTIKGLAIPAMIGAIGKKSIDVGMDFESSMSQVAATMGMTAQEIANGSEDFKLLEKAAKDAGATTQYSASEAAQGLNYLALAGYNAKQAAETLPTVLNLAAAGGMDLAYASDLVTDSMSALGLPLEEVNTFTDKLAKTSQKSNTNVSQLGEAILTVGGTAKVLKGGVTEMNTALGIFADAGIKGAEGGTALRNVILSMSAPTEKAAKKWKELGIEVFDADGNMRPINESLGDLKEKLDVMNEKDRINTLNTLFNKVDLKAVNPLIAQSGERFNELAKEIDNSNGAADNMAKTMNANLKGAITSFKSALEGVGIAIYEKFNKGLTVGVEKVVEFTRELGKIITESKTVGEAIGRMGDLIGQVAGQMLEAGANLVLNLANGIYTNTYLLPEKATELMEAFKTGIFWYLPEILEKGVEVVTTFHTGIISSIPNIIQGAINLVTGFVQGILEAIPQVIQAGMDIVDNLVTEIMNNLPKIVESAIQMMNTLVQTLLENLPKIIDSAFQAVDRFAGTIKANLPTIINAGFEMLMAIVNAILGALPQLLRTALDLVVRFATTIMENLPTIINAGVQILLKLVEGIIKMFPELVVAGFKLIVEFVGGIIKNLPKLFKAGLEMVKEVMKGLAQLPIQAVELAAKLPDMIWAAIRDAGTWLGGAVSNWIKGLLPGGKAFSVGFNATGSVSGANAYALAGAGLGRGIGGSDFGGLTHTTNVSLNIAGREFDNLVIKAVTKNSNKIETIIQSKQRGRR